MFYVLQNESTAALRRVPILLTDAATGTTAQTGVATTTIFPYVNINGNAFIGGTGNVGEAGYGQYYYEFEVNEIATLGLAGIHITAAGCRDYDAIAQVAALNFYAAGSGLSAYDVWAIDYNSIGAPGGSAGEVLNNTLTAASNAETNTNDISLEVWGTDLAAGVNSPFAAGTAGTILYTLGQAGVALTAGDVWTYDISAISTAGTAGSQLNTAALPSGAGISAYDVWAYTGGGPLGSQVDILYQTSQAANAAESNTNDIGGTVWTYAVGPRTITGGTANTVTSPVTVSSASMTGIAGTVWSTDISGYTSPSAGYDLANASSGAGISAYDVWDFNITGFGGTNSAAVYTTQTNFTVGNIETYVSTQTPQDVWTYAGIEGRTITGGTADTVTTLTNPANITTSSMSGVASTVWNSLVASHSTNGTFGKNILRADAANKVGDVTLYSTGTSNGVDADMHRIANDSAAATNLKNILTGIGSTITGNITGNLSGSVGSVTADVNVSTASMTGIAGTVWSVGSRTITGGTATTVTNPVTFESAQYAAIASSVWNAATRTLTSAGAGLTAGDVWSYATRTVTGGTIDNANVSSIGLTALAGIAETVWRFSLSGASPVFGGDTAGFMQQYPGTQVWGQQLSNLIQAGDNLVTAANGSTSNAPAEVWNYATRTITGGIADTVTLVTNDVNVSTGSMVGIAGTVWSTDITGYVSPSAGFDLTQAASGAGLTSGDVSDAVWNAATSSYITSGTFGLNTLRSDVAGVAGTVSLWTGGAYSGIFADTYRIDADYNAAIALKDILTGIGASITGNITGDLSGSVGSVTADVNVATLSMTGIAGTVWSTDISGYTSPSAGYSLYNATGGVAVTAGDIWTYGSRTITGGIADTVTDVTNGVSVTTNNDKTGYSLSSTQTFDLTGNITGNLSGSVASVTNPVIFDSAQYASIASSVWNAGTRTLTSGGSGISAYDVWNFDPTAMTVPQAGAILTDIQTDTNQIQTDISNIPNNVWASDVSGYTNPGEAGFELTQAASGAGLTAGDVWSYATRTITGGIADTVTTVSNGVIVTTNNDKTGYALSGAGVSAVQSGLSTLTTAQVGQEVDASLLDVGLTSTVTGRIDATVSSRLASASYVVPPTEAAIAGTVWGYNTRTLTSGAGATAGDVWTYSTRSLTSGAGITVSAATNIINGPYFVKSNVDGQDGNLDVIRGMVQDIQLTVTDAFQNPFDVTSLGMAVNFYDQAGSLVTSYGTTSLYAPGGLIQFTLDTAVTANEGRYNLILSAAGAGNTIKFGPLQTLVRPF
jgi:hypothetical protein